MKPIRKESLHKPQERNLSSLHSKPRPRKTRETWRVDGGRKGERREEGGVVGGNLIRGKQVEVMVI